MKPLILEYTEEPILNNFDYSLIEYSHCKNLTVLRNTDTPAISYVKMDTETFTKAGGEPSDSDNDFNFMMKLMLDTSTGTRSAIEQSDSDNDFSALKFLMDTQTLTEGVEPTNSDT